MTNDTTPAPIGADALRHALEIAEAALADIGDADREPGDDVAWCEARAAEALPTVRAALASAAQPAVPSGYVLVPVEPTDDMLRGLRKQRSGGRIGKGDRAAWAAWLAAAAKAAPAKQPRNIPCGPRISDYSQLPDPALMHDGAGYYNVYQMQAFADATSARRAESLAAAYREELDKLSQRNYELRFASRGQAPAPAAVAGTSGEMVLAAAPTTQAATAPAAQRDALDRLLRFDAALRAAGASLPPPAPRAACKPGLDVALALLQGHIAAARAAKEGAQP